MPTAAFEAEVKDGIIQIPARFRPLFGDSVYVTLTTSDVPAAGAKTIIDHWLTSPLQIPNFKPLSRDEARRV